MKIVNQKHYLKRAVDINLARKSFWHYCQAIAPDFYTRDRQYLVDICHALQQLVEGNLTNQDGEPIRRLMINMPPRHGKSRTLILFEQWCLGRDETTKIISISYNELLSSRFSKAVRDGIETENKDENRIAFSDCFPMRKIKRGDAAAQLWSLQGQHFNYLGGSPHGTLTGIGASIGVVDDIIKSAEEAFNSNALESIWDWYANTYLSRLEEGAVQVIAMTRWSIHDLCGKLLKEEGHKWKVIRYEAINERGLMLCDSILSRDSYEEKKQRVDPALFRALYHQQPIEFEGRLFQKFKTFEALPVNEAGKVPAHQIIMVVDVADTGGDYLCAITAVAFPDQRFYIQDVIFTKDPAEVTQPMILRTFVRYGVQVAYFESNNAGRVYSLAIKQKAPLASIKTFTTKSNKESRILARSFEITEKVYMPSDWHNRWREFFDNVMQYKKEGRNRHDDGPDALAMLMEHTTPKKKIIWYG